MAKSPAASPAKAAPKSAPKKVAAKAKPATAEKPIRTQLAATRDTIRDEATRKAGALKSQAGDLATQAQTKAREAAAQGKTKAAETVGNIARMIEDSAATVDDKLGVQYGDYARSAAKTVSGIASAIEEKDLQDLADSTRDFVKRSPAVAIGAAAVVGFVLARMIKGGGDK
ncbi:MAG: hypothetical protein RLZZ58_1964 [Pseudomonadota bacterium]|jgi:ElaB/YqjD/DUF883 family membrane-anchored ribosome-binding protein